MSTEPSQSSCRKRLAGKLRQRLAHLTTLWKLYQSDPDLDHAGLGNFSEYGLCFDYVAPGTYCDQREAFWRYQLSWGGPSDEFRFYSSRPDVDPYRIEYWFLDWFDGAHRVLKGDDEDLLIEIWNWLRDAQQVQSTYRKALT